MQVICLYIAVTASAVNQTLMSCFYLLTLEAAKSVVGVYLLLFHQLRMPGMRVGWQHIQDSSAKSRYTTVGSLKKTHHIT
jgi:hypothetical protein